MEYSKVFEEKEKYKQQVMNNANDELVHDLQQKNASLSDQLHKSKSHARQLIELNESCLSMQRENHEKNASLTNQLQQSQMRVRELSKLNESYLSIQAMSQREKEELQKSTTVARKRIESISPSNTNVKKTK